MKRIYLVIIFFIITATIAFGQSAYSFNYNFNKPGDATTYYAFLLRNDDGSGLLRFRYSLPGNDEDVLIEAFIDEFNPPDKTKEPDTSLLIIKAVNPNFIQGNNNIAFQPPLFVFRYNPKSNFYEPAGVTKDPGYLLSPDVTFKWNLLEGTNLNKEIVSRFFNDDEDFYINLFRPVTRGLSAAEKKIRMHLLIVADTLDATIGKSVALDLIKVNQLFTSITNYIGIKLFTTIIAGKTFGKSGVQSALSKLSPLPDDIVVFYYSGHGFRLPEKPRNYPNMKLKNFKTPRENYRDSLAWIKGSRDANISQSLNIEDIYKIIRKKGARMNLIISDCCNDDIFSVNVKGTKPAGTKSSGIQWSEENIRTLFLQQNPLSILTTACTSGERAASKDDFGGFYTHFFKIALETHCSKSKSKVSWDLVLQQTQRQTTVKANNTYCARPFIPANICKQNPVYTIKIGR